MEGCAECRSGGCTSHLAERRALIRDLEDQNSLFALEAPWHAAAHWTTTQIMNYFESGGEILGEQLESHE